MLRIAGQMAGPIELKFFVDTHGWPGGVNKNSYSANLTCSENYATALNNPFFGKIYLFYFVLIN